MFLFLVIFNFFLAINTSSDTKSFVTLNEDINLRSLEDEKEPTKGSQKFICVPLPQKPSLQKIPTIAMTPLNMTAMIPSPCSGSLSPQAWPFGSFLTWYGLERTSTLTSMTTVSANGVRRTLTQNVLI